MERPTTFQKSQQFRYSVHKWLSYSRLKVNPKLTLRVNLKNPVWQRSCNSLEILFHENVEGPRGHLFSHTFIRGLAHLEVCALSLLSK